MFKGPPSSSSVSHTHSPSCFSALHLSRGKLDVLVPFGAEQRAPFCLPSFVCAREKASSIRKTRERHATQGLYFLIIYLWVSERASSTRKMGENSPLWLSTSLVLMFQSSHPYFDTATSTMMNSWWENWPYDESSLADALQLVLSLSSLTSL